MIRRLVFFFLLSFCGGCIDRIFFESESIQGTVVVDGMITDLRGPYTVRLFMSSSIEDNLTNAIPLSVDEVLIFDDIGNEEVLSKVDLGIYETAPDGIQGVVGRKYNLRITLIDGTIFELTEPEELKPVASIDSLYFTWESNKPLKGPTNYGFRILMDTKRLNEGFMRWRYTGTYQAESIPRARGVNGNCRAAPEPPACSGYIYTGGFQTSGELVYVGECTCCLCWVNDHENKPKLSDELITDGTFRQVEVGYVPFDEWRFNFRKYMVKVEQMSLSENAYQFWRIARDQKEGLTDIFQPALGDLPSNIVSINSDRKANGLFYATAVKSKVIFISANDAEIPVPELVIANSCFLARECDEAFEFASRLPPPEWY